MSDHSDYLRGSDADLQDGYWRLHHILERQHSIFYVAIRKSMQPRKVQFNLYYLNNVLDTMHSINLDDNEFRRLKLAMVHLLDRNSLFDFMICKNSKFYGTYTHIKGLVGPEYADQIVEKMDLYRLFIKNRI